MEKSEAPIRVLIVDDHMMVRDGLKLFLSQYDDIEVVAEAASGEAAYIACANYDVDLVLMDLVMPDGDGAVATRRIRQQYPEIEVLVLTSFAGPDLVRPAIEAGAIGYLMKDVKADQLATAIRATVQGQTTLDPAAAAALVHSVGSNTKSVVDLTPRETDVLTLLVEGMTNREIAEALFISTSTARLHVSNILGKFGVSNRTEAATFALQNNLFKQ